MLTAGKPKIPSGPWGVVPASTQSTVTSWLVAVFPHDYANPGRVGVPEGATLESLTFYTNSTSAINLKVFTATGGIDPILIAKSDTITSTGPAGARTISDLSLPVPPPSSYGGFGIIGVGDRLPTIHTTVPIDYGWGALEEGLRYLNLSPWTEPNVGANLAAYRSAGDVPNISASGSV